MKCQYCGSRLGALNARCYSCEEPERSMRAVKASEPNYTCPGLTLPQPPGAPPEGYVACYRAGHHCPPKVPLTTEADGYRTTTYRCPCCGDSGLTYGGPVGWFQPAADDISEPR